jgi:hypothetical protein
VVGFCVLLYLGYIYYRNVWVSGPFEQLLQTYSSLSRSVPVHDLFEPYVQGKVAAIDVNQNRMDNVWFALPSDLRASSSDDTGTLVLVSCTEGAVGRYATAGAAIAVGCEMSLIDMSIRSMIARRHFVGLPPSSSDFGQTRTGSRPDSDMVSYLRSLPRK